MKNAFLSTLVLFSLASCTAQKEHSNTLNDRDASLIDYLFSSYSGKTPGISYAIIKEGEIVKKENYGYAHLGKDVKSTSHTNYRIASMSKQFTAMGIMILEYQGKLNFETKLTDIFPDFPDYGKAISIRHLLTHQSGLIDYEDFIPEDQTDQVLDADILDGLEKLNETYFVPGSAYRYSNSGYAVLAEVVAKVSGTSFADFLKKEIFDKLGMNETQVFELGKPIKNRAYGYSLENGSTFMNDQSATSAIQGDGSVYCNVLDYHKWDQALYSNVLLPQDKLEAAFTNWDGDQRNNESGYGYGWYVDFSGDIKLLNHSGGTVGFETRVSRVPSLNLSAVIFTNTDRQDRDIMHITNALISIYSDFQIPMPIEIMMKQEIDQNGVNSGIEIFDRLKDDPKYKVEQTTLSYLGFEYRRAKKWKEAEQIFIKATKETPNYFGGYWGLARIYTDNDEVDKAVMNYEKVIGLEGNDEEWVVERSKELMKELINR